MENWEHKYKELKEEYDQFTYIVTHDIKASLRGISTLTGFLQEDLGKDLNESNAMQIKMLGVKLMKMQMIMDGLYAYSKCDKEIDDVYKVDVSKIIEKAALKSGLHPSQLIMGPITGVQLENAGKLEEIFAHIFRNAVIHNPMLTDLKINISVEESAEKHCIIIKDNGIGIEEKYFNKAFSPMVTLHTNTESPTSGMGLAIVKKMVTTAGGHVNLFNSEKDGFGISFTWPVK